VFLFDFCSQPKDQRSHSIQGVDIEVQEPQHNVSYEGMIEEKTSETKSIIIGSDQHVEEPVTTFVEILAYYMNPILNGPLGLPLTDPPAMRFIDSYSSYILPPDLTTTQSFGMNSLICFFPEGIGNYPQIL